MRLERMNSPEVEAYFKDHKIALLSVGSIECHGLHNALGTDTLIPMKLLELVEPGIWTGPVQTALVPICWRLLCGAFVTACIGGAAAILSF